MRIKDGFILREMLGQFIVVGEGLAQVNFNKMLTLNESAAYLWKEVKGREFTREDLVELLLERYEVSPEQAAADVDKLVNIWVEQGVAE